ncbi:MAG TPA: cytochrome P450 [Spongiibacteraceae bacterium]|nr:cytochrome P450 [Spongiibacteraceae bacterium]
MKLAATLMPDIDFAWHDVPNLRELVNTLREQGPVVPVVYHGKPVWLMTRHDTVRDAFADEEHFASEAAYRVHSEPSMGHTLQCMSGDIHRVNRALVSKPFFPKQIRDKVEAAIEPEARRWLERIADRPEADLVQAYSRPFPFSVITRLLGIPVHDEQLFMEWAVKLIDYPWDPEGALAARAGFDAYMLPLMARRRLDPGDDVVSILATAEVEGQQLSDEEILAFCRLIFPAGSDTTYKNLGSLLYAVLSDPDLRAQAAAGDAEREAIVQEGLRWEPPTALLPRRCSKTIDFHGVTIEKDDWLLFGITAANNDPSVFPQPERFDPSRPNKNLAFGHGVHFCLGSHLARRELETALKVLLERYPDIALCDDRPVEIIGGALRGPRELWVRPHG